MSGWDSAPAADAWGGGATDQHAASSFDNFNNDGFGASGDADNAYGSYGADDGGQNGDDKCFACGESGHRKAECPSAGEMTCRYCKQPGHIVRDCPDKPPMICENCGEEGHFRRNCENARKVNRDHVADVTPEDALKKIKQAVSERDADDAKEGVQEYVKALQGAPTYKEIQQTLVDQSIGLWFISLKRELENVFTNMDLQGNFGKEWTISYRFTDKPERPREIEGWPKSLEEILERLDDAGEVVNSGQTKCYRCGELGHMTKECTQERTERPKPSCYNCGVEGHRVRDCPEPRVDKFACRNCGKSGHRSSECEEPPNLDNVECRKCNEMGHFSKDCPQGGGSACRNCGQEGHMAKECDQPRNMDNVTCRNCEKTGHFSRDCPEPKDWSKVQCSNCQEFGHTKVRCKAPPAESEEYGAADSNTDNFMADSFAGAEISGGDNGWQAPDATAPAITSGGW